MQKDRKKDLSISLKKHTAILCQKFHTIFPGFFHHRNELVHNLEEKKCKPKPEDPTEKLKVILNKTSFRPTVIIRVLLWSILHHKS